MMLMQGSNEVVANTLVTGGSHLGNAIFTVIEIGFGISIGCSLCYWAEDSTQDLNICSGPGLPLSIKLMWYELRCALQCRICTDTLQTTALKDS